MPSCSPLQLKISNSMGSISILLSISSRLVNIIWLINSSLTPRTNSGSVGVAYQNGFVQINMK